MLTLTAFYARISTALITLMVGLVLLASAFGAARRADMLAFVAINAEKRSQVYVADLHTGDTFQVSTDNAAYHQQPHWSPDGKRLTFTVGNGGATHIYTLSLPQRDLRQWSSVDGERVADTYTLFRDPRWTPDGCCVIFHENRNPSENRRFYLADVDAGTVTMVELNDPRVQHYLSTLFPTRYISPDGEQVADIGFGDRVYRLSIGTMTDNATAFFDSVQEIYASPENIAITFDSVRWSPEGDQIAFTLESLPHTIHVLDVTAPPGANIRATVNGEQPNWRP